MKTATVLVVLGGSGIAFAGGEGWSADFAAAKKEAAEAKKDLLVDFTGSDWCSWCIKLDKEVFNQAPFKAGVKDKFVLVELDYPEDKSKLSAATLKQNEELGKKYAVQGYPTILLTDADGRPYAATGYQDGGPEAYVKHLDELRAKKAARDQAFESATKAQGVDKAKALVAALGAMGLEDAMVTNFYGDVVEQIKAADPKDETGFGKAAALKVRLAAFQEELGVLAQKQDFDGALALVDKTLKDGGLGAVETQQIMMTRAMIYAEQKKFDLALKAADEAKAVAPTSPMAGGIDEFKASIEAAKKPSAEGKP
ncbi:thioredoxin family protein [bacterium]|nr:thioredoxin family protein [bacterium]